MKGITAKENLTKIGNGQALDARINSYTRAGNDLP